MTPLTAHSCTMGRICRSVPTKGISTIFFTDSQTKPSLWCEAKRSVLLLCHKQVNTTVAGTRVGLQEMGEEHATVQHCKACMSVHGIARMLYTGSGQSPWSRRSSAWCKRVCTSCCAHPSSVGALLLDCFASSVPPKLPLGIGGAEALAALNLSCCAAAAA